MFRWCSFCQAYIGQKEPYNDYSLTHGICTKCKTNISEAPTEEKIRPIIDFFQELQNSVYTDNLPDPLSITEKGKKLNIRPADLLAGIIQPILYDLGMKFEKGELEIYQEHLFSEFTKVLIRDIFKVYNLKLQDEKHPEVMIFGASGEFHEFGIRFLEVFLRQEGIEAQAIFPGLPMNSIYSVVEKRRPKVVMLSITLPENFKHVNESLSIFNEWKHGDRPMIIIGGQGCPKDAVLSVPHAQIHQDSLRSLLNILFSHIHKRSAA